ncbi:MAG: translocation/assembly module TamB domain-containing protein [Caulobacteraceae bacterium]
MTDTAAPTPAASPPPRRRRGPARWLILWSVIAVAVVALVAGGLRYGVLLPQARLLIEAQASGLKIGRFGRLGIEGLEGDIWRNFTVRRLTIRDEKGIWLEARAVAVHWRYEELFQRKFHADDITVGQLNLLRRPTLTPKEADRGLPVSFLIERIRARVDMAPAFSYRAGSYRLDGRLDVQRKGGAAARVRADSLTHAGDFLAVQFSIGQTKAMLVRAEAREANGGALAGALGLTPDKPFYLNASVNGTMSRGGFTLLAQSGDLQAAGGSGAWTPEGGSGRVRLNLASSRLLHPFARMVGEVADIDLTGRKAAGGLFQLQGKVRASNASIDLSGLANLGKGISGPNGLALKASVVSMMPIVGFPEMDGGQGTGILRFDPKGWTFIGDATAQRPRIEGYELARVSGRLTLKGDGRNMTFDVDTQGEGGRGAGLIPALLGGRPTVLVSGEALADGRTLFRRVDVRGPGIFVHAEGDRTLLGSLTLKGDGTVSNLAAASPGASGIVRATWTASQGRATDPWKFTFDAKGERLATGMAELDRLLGAAPRLRAAGTYAGTDIQVTSSNLDGAAGSASASGLIRRDGTLGLAVNWSAKGPFRAGPVEIAGNVSGTGQVGGSLLAPRADLAADVDAIDLPMMPLRAAHVVLSFVKTANDYDGQISVAAESQFGPARGASTFAFRTGGVSLSNIDVNAAGAIIQGSASLTQGRPSVADLTLNIRQGAFLQAGRVTGYLRVADAAGGATAKINLDAEDVILRGGGPAMKSANFTAEGPLANLPIKVNAESQVEGLWRMAGTGRMQQSGEGYGITLDAAGRIRRADFSMTTPAEIFLSGNRMTAKASLKLGAGGKVDIDAVKDGETLRATMLVDNGDLGLVNEDLLGRFDATVNVSGTGRSLSGALQAKLAGAKPAGSRDAMPVDATVRARLAGDTIVLDADASDAMGSRSTANLTLPAEASASPFRIAVVRNRPMHGTVTAEGEVKPIWSLLMGNDRSLSGRVSLQGELSGTLADPRAQGTATLAQGHFTDSQTGLDLVNVSLRATLANYAIDIADMTGSDGKDGTLSGQGRISLLRDGVSSFRLDLKTFRMLDNDIATATASGQATINRDATGKIQLSGALTIDRADIAANPPTPTGVVPMDVREVNRPAKRATIATWEPPPPGPGIALDVTLKAPRRVFVKGRGLDVELSMDAHVTGTTSAPLLTGVAHVVRGDYDLAGRRFQFDTRGQVTLSTDPERIRLDLSATREDPTLTAVIKITGTAAEPKIALSSTPALPPDEILARVLYGSSASQLSGVEAAQLASGLSALAGGGGFDVIGNIRDLARLDRLAFGGDEVSGVTVSGGKYLTDNVYLEITGGGREGPSAQVEWRVRPTLAIISRITGQGDARLSVRWRKDY